MEAYSNIVGGARLREVLSLFGISTSQLASLTGVGVDRTVRYWYQSLPLRRARQIALLLEIDFEIFLQRKPIVALDANSRLKSVSDSNGCKYTYLFDGNSSESLAKFIGKNKNTLPLNAHVNITFADKDGIYEKKVDLNEIEVLISGYERTLIIGSKSYGGINATIEEYNLTQLELTTSKEVRFYRSLAQERLSQLNGSDAISLAKCGQIEEAIILCGQQGRNSSFLALMSLYENDQIQIEHLKSFFDTIKKFRQNFLINPINGRKAYSIVESFIITNEFSDQLLDAVQYAIEAMPFCSSFDQQASTKAVVFLRSIRNIKLKEVSSWSIELLSAKFDPVLFKRNLFSKSAEV